MMMMMNATYLTKGAFSNERVDFIPIQEFLSMLNNVIVVVIIIAIVVEFPFLFVRGIFSLGLLRPSLLFGIVHLQITQEF